MDREALLRKAVELPETPGVYTMYNAVGEVIYVGKAVKLCNRVSSYFRDTYHEPKVQQMINRVDRFSVILCENELDALLTENSLIKLHNPFYNIRLKSGHGYPFIHVSLENGCPVLRTVYGRPTNGRAFGPFVFLQKISLLSGMLREVYKLPTCAVKPRKKPCLEYDMGRCVGACAGKLSAEDGQRIYDEICAFLEGKTDSVYERLTEEMEQASQALEFERAALLRDRRNALEMISSKQRPVLSRNRHADYVGWFDENGACSIFVESLRNGFVVGQHNDVFEEPFSEELLQEYLQRFYSKNEVPPGKIYLPRTFDWFGVMNEWQGENKFTAPTYEQDKTLCDLACRNARERFLQNRGKTAKHQRMLEAFRRFSGLEKTDLLEVYDISQLAGADTVCGSITIADGKFDRKRYKKYRITPEDGFGDTDYMKQALTRRLDRALASDPAFLPLPDAILCDGGQAQVAAVQEVLAQKGVKIPVCGLKKDAHHRTKAFVFPDGSEKALKTDPEAFAFCGRAQEEVHRVAISYHRQLREKALTKAAYCEIPGIGKEKAKALLMKFPSAERLKRATDEELLAVRGISPQLVSAIRKWAEERAQ